MHPETKKTEIVRRVYDQLASEYHLIFADWKKSVRWQGEVLDTLIRKEVGKTPLSVLDCTCGIGTQAIGLALRGYAVIGTDSSPEAISRATREAQAFSVSINFGVADVRALRKQVNGTFDMVVSCDNSLPHLLNDADLEEAAHNIRSKMRRNGLFIASIRDYDGIMKEKPKSTIPQVFDNAEGKRIVFQVWDWLEDGRNYIFHLFILKDDSGDWKVSQYSAQYRALCRQELTEILSRSGFLNIRWLMLEETGYYQPFVTARR